MLQNKASTFCHVIELVVMRDFRLRTALFWAVAQRVMVFLTDTLRNSPEERSS
jgi:hypothetical protein